MATDNRLVLGLGYENSDQVRQYSYGGISDSELPNISTRILAYNADIPAGDKLVFVDDEGNGMSSIVSARLERITETYIIQR